MSMNFLLADMITRIRNGQNARLSKVNCRHSGLLASVLDVLKREGYISDYRKVSEGNKHDLEIDLKYHEGQPVIREITTLSKPGRREYAPIKDLHPFHNGLGTNILSTSQGVMSDFEARQANVGGELLCKVY